MTHLLQLNFDLWTRIERSTPSTSTGIDFYRVIFCASFLAFYRHKIIDFGQVPQALFDPPVFSFAFLFNDFPSSSVANLLYFVVGICIFLVGLGWHKRLNGLLAFCVYCILLNFQYSFGKIDHGILVPACILIFSLNDWNTTKPAKGWRMPVNSTALLAVVLCFGMFSAGFYKALYWIDFDITQNGFARWFYSGYYNLGRDKLLASWVPSFPHIMLEMMDYTAVAFELSPAIFLLVGRRSWNFWLCLAIVFHIANTLLLLSLIHI